MSHFRWMPSLSLGIFCSLSPIQCHEMVENLASATSFPEWGAHTKPLSKPVHTSVKCATVWGLFCPLGLRMTRSRPHLIWVTIYLPLDAQFQDSVGTQSVLIETMDEMRVLCGEWKLPGHPGGECECPMLVAVRSMGDPYTDLRARIRTEKVPVPQRSLGNTYLWGTALAGSTLSAHWRGCLSWSMSKPFRAKGLSLWKEMHLRHIGSSRDR